MPDLIHQFISHGAQSTPDAAALLFKDQFLSYAGLQREVAAAANGLLALGIASGERVAVYLPKQPETVFGLFGAAAAGACFVPVNPLLKPRQVAYILAHCNVRVLITSGQRLNLLEEVLAECPDLHTVVVVEEQPPELASKPNQEVLGYSDFCSSGSGAAPHRRIDTDMAAILYTSGSTGNPKGVVLSHRNMLAGARSVVCQPARCDRQDTAQHFKPSPGQAPEIPITELAVWSGDQDMRDEEGYLYFISREDDMIKTSGYRVSPTEVEEVVYASGLVAGAAALGLPHSALGQAILLVATHTEGAASGLALEEALLAHCRKELPNFMVPLAIIARDALPHNQNGKIDRRALADEYQNIFQDETT
jgi:acyl-coenzyme A synthetase/AMP-(fatty) acid ligase